jgi:myo-inositol-1(or 4)-monophosphatase
MYEQIVEKVKYLGDQLPAIAGKVIDIGEKKAWLTEWDLKIEKELTTLINSFPDDHRVFAEEISDEYKDAENVWIMDPISNTLNFIHGLPHYSITASHLHKNKVVFCAVYDPAMKELFTAEKGKGAFLNGVKISVSTRTSDLVGLVGPHIVPQGRYVTKTLKLTEMLSGKCAIRTLGSLGVHYAYVACGRADIAISFNKDVFPEFAGKLLVEEAGGKFSDFEGRELSINTHGVIASNSVIYDEIRELVNQSDINK